MTENTDLVAVAVTEVDNPLAGLPEEVLAKIRAAAQSIQTSSLISTRKIGIAKGGMSYKMPDDSNSKRFTGIVVAIKHANKNYPNAFVQGRFDPADCVAVCPGGLDSINDRLIPISESTKIYSPTGCGVCPRFQWGSNPAGSGKGKLCNEYTLAAVYIPSLGEDLYLVEQKKARGQRFDGHIRKITDAFGHPAMVYTEFVIAENDEAFDQNFYPVDRVPPELFIKLASRLDEANAILVDSVRSSLSSNDTKTGDAATEVEEDQVRPKRK